MPRFRFKLSQILKIRRHREELLKNELASIRREYVHEESILQRLITRRREHLEEIRQKQALKEISIEEMLQYYAYLERLDRDIKHQKAKLKELNSKIDQIKEKLIVASQEKRILERLYERRLEEFKQEEEKIEQAFLDEIALLMYARGANQLSYRG